MNVTLYGNRGTSMQGVQVRSLVGELISHMLRGTAKKKKKKKERKVDRYIKMKSNWIRVSP